MERNQAASRAILTQLDAASIDEMSEMAPELRRAISESNNPHYVLTIMDADSVSFHFVVRLFVKIGFACEDAVRLMMDLHRNGQVSIASADSDSLEMLKCYINHQAHSQGQIIGVEVLSLG